MDSSEETGNQTKDLLSKESTQTEQTKKLPKLPRMSGWGLFIPEILQLFVWPVTRLILKVCVSFRISGRKHLEEVKSQTQDTGVVFVANHESELDPIVVRAAMPIAASYTPLYFVARLRSFYKNKNFFEKYLYGGVFFRWWGAYPAYSGFKNYEKSLKNHIRLLRKGKSVLIFPEGKITKTGGLGEARGGAAFLMHQLQVPVVPVAISGARNIAGRTQFFFGRKKVKVKFGKALSPKSFFTSDQLHAELSPEECRNIAKKMLSHIEDLQTTS